MLDIRDAKDAAELVGFHLQRWRIEDFFRVLKSGCRTEFLLFRKADRLQRAVAINAVIAWRIMVMTLLGRQVPDCESELMFTGHEIDFLASYADEHGLPAPNLLGDAVRLVANLGHRTRVRYFVENSPATGSRPKLAFSLEAIESRLPSICGSE